MQIHPYLNFPGTCEEAFKFYETALGGKITFRHTFGDSPMADQVPPDWKNKIIHMRLEVGDAALLGSDAS